MSPLTEEDIEFDLGPCCVCEKEGEDVRNFIMMDFEGPIPGKGWGCLQCKLPPNGAVAVICDNCFDLYKEDPSIIKFVCNGSPKDGRIPIDQLEKKPFDHDMRYHPEASDYDGKCRVCGCDHYHPCITEDGPCYWVEDDLCSACSKNMEKFNAG